MYKEFLIPYDPVSDPKATILHTPLSKLPAYTSYSDIPDYSRFTIELHLSGYVPLEQDYDLAPCFIQLDKTLSQLKQYDLDGDFPTGFHIQVKTEGWWRGYYEGLSSVRKSDYERYFNIHPKRGYTNPVGSGYYVRSSRRRAHFAGIANLYGIDPTLYGKCYRMLIINGSDRVQQILGLTALETGWKRDTKLIATVYDYIDKQYYKVPWDDVLFRLGLSDNQKGE